MLKNRFDARTLHPDNVYYNATFVNNEQRVKSIEFRSSTGDMIIPSSTQYYLIVDGFNIPNTAVPIFFFDNRLSASKSGTVHPYRIRIDIDGEGIEEEELIFLPRGTMLNENQDLYFGNIYQVEQFLEMVNDTFNTLMGLLSNLFVIEMKFNKDNNKFYLSILINDVVDLSDLDIRFSTALYKLFDSLDAEFLTFDESRINYRLTLYNPIVNRTKYVEAGIVNPEDDFIEFYQTTPSYHLWSDVREILITTAILPVRPENFNNPNDRGSVNRFKVVNNFVPLYNISTGVDNTPWRYFTDVPKLIDLESDVAIKAIDFYVQAIRDDGSSFPIGILPNEVASIKSRFVKKALYNNEYNLTSMNERIEQYANPDVHRPFH